jgi:hypothetical protein
MKKTAVSQMAENGAPLRLITWYFDIMFSVYVECIKSHIRDTKKCAFCITNTVLYRYYVFRRHLRYTQGPQHQWLDLTKLEQITIVIHII